MIDKILGTNWKGVAGAIALILTGVIQLLDCFVPDILEQDSTVPIAISVIATGLSALGIRTAVQRNGSLSQE